MVEVQNRIRKFLPQYHSLFSSPILLYSQKFTKVLVTMRRVEKTITFVEFFGLTLNSIANNKNNKRKRISFQLYKKIQNISTFQYFWFVN